MSNEVPRGRSSAQCAALLLLRAEAVSNYRQGTGSRSRRDSSGAPRGCRATGMIPVRVEMTGRLTGTLRRRAAATCVSPINASPVGEWWIFGARLMGRRRYVGMMRIVRVVSSRDGFQWRRRVRTTRDINWFIWFDKYCCRNDEMINNNRATKFNEQEQSHLIVRCRDVYVTGNVWNRRIIIYFP